MRHNDEKDRYRNNSLVAKYDYNFTEKLKFKSNLRFADTYLQYDKEVDTSTATHDEEVDGIEFSNIGINYDVNEKFNNNLILTNTYIKRIYGATQIVVTNLTITMVIDIHYLI